MSTRELLKSGPEQITLSSGVTVTVSPFPAGLWWDLHARALEQHPDPEPPTKTIDVVDGTEEVQDLDNPDYLEALALANRERTNIQGEAIIDLCVDVDMEPYAATIKRVERYIGQAPKEDDERRVWFLTKYALRGRADYEAVMLAATAQLMTSDPEVANRLKSFQREVEGATDPDADAPGAAEE